MQISWIGPLEGSGAYPIINRNITRALEKRGHEVLRNIHNKGFSLAPVCVSCQYPPQRPNVEHDVMISYSAWEFPDVPASFVEELDKFDLNVAMAEWTSEHYAAATTRPATFIHLGVDPYWFTEDEREIRWSNPAPKHVLWMGGTDQRHGMDIAIAAAAHLPEGYELNVYEYPSYPRRLEVTATGKNVVGIGTASGLGVTQTAHMFRGADCLLHTARAVGFSLPVLEAMAVGLPVVTMALPPVMEYCPTPYQVSSEMVKGERHHIHTDMICRWHEPYDASEFAALAVSACEAPRPEPLVRTWDDVAREWEALLAAWM